MELSRKDRRMIELAASVAPHSNGKHKLGAVVVGSKPVGIAWNWNRNPPDIHWTSAQCAELRALIDAADNAIGATVYVARVNRHGEYRLARPCDSCRQNMRIWGVSKAIYTISNTEFGLMKP